MPKMTPGNRLYLYKLLAQELGVGRQTALSRVGEVLEQDGIYPDDLGFSDVRALCEALTECVKMTVFKKGYVYATVLAHDEYDRALEAASADSGKAASGGKPWKRRKGAKALKPAKPRHVGRAVEKGTDAEAPADVTTQAEGKATDGAVDEAPATELATEPEPVPDVVTAPEPEPAPAPEPEPNSAAEPEPAPEPNPSPEPELAPAPAPVSAPKPSISFTITYVPEPAPEPARDEAAGTPPLPEAEPATSSQLPEGSAAPDLRVTARAQEDLPQDFHAEVRCPNEQLSTLYQLLPPDVDPMATLEEDFRIARSTGSLGGTRSTVTFALRYLRSDGSAPVTVTLRRSARRVGGKRWTLVDIDGGAVADTLEGLSEAQARGPWSAFVPEGQTVPDLERELAKTVALGSWEEALERLASIASPEDWGAGRSVLRDYVVMSCTRAQAERLFSVSENGTRASVDTGLVTKKGEPVFAALVAQPAGSDIPWHLDGFSAGDAAPALRYAAALPEVTLDPTLSVPEGVPVESLVRNPRLATTAYDPIGNRAVLLVPAPDGTSALALAPHGDAYELVATLPLADAYVCARVVSSEQPSWLRG